MMDSITAYNVLVLKFIQSQHNIIYANIYPAMLDADGKPNRDLFYEDMLHMNEKGYAVWTQVVKPYLLK